MPGSRRFGSGNACGWRRSLVRVAGFALILLICALSAFADAGAGVSLRRVSRDELWVTNGAVTALQDSELAIDTPSSRAVVRRWPARATNQTAAIRFRYLGPSETTKPLASGELRRQIGLKLRAADSCNVVYVMWHIAPDSRIAVSVKRNAGHSHAQCGAHGYESIVSQIRSAPRPIRPGDVRTLRAELHGTALIVTADGRVVWQGKLPHLLPSGPPGFRTDNARFVLEYFVSGAPARKRTWPPIWNAE